jgi:hypothetical protein
LKDNVLQFSFRGNEDFADFADKVNEALEKSDDGPMKVVCFESDHFNEYHIIYQTREVVQCRKA